MIKQNKEIRYLVLNCELVGFAPQFNKINGTDQIFALKGAKQIILG